MIISGGSRSNWRFFAKHLTNGKDNERVNVIEFRGLASENVLEAFREMDALASGTQCKNFFYHADINPREHEHLSPEQWESSVDRLEKNLGLDGHSRFVVEHEKEGRTHRHVIWSRIDVDSMTAVSDSRNYAIHERTARALETEFDHAAVRSTLTRDAKDKRPERRPKNWETFRGNKSGVDPESVTTEVTALWQKSDSGAAFNAALTERGYLLCKGDRRDFCLIDPAGKEHSLARRIEGVKAAEVRARMADINREDLPSVAQGRERNTAWGGSAETEGHQHVRQVHVLAAATPYIKAAKQGKELEPLQSWPKRMRGFLDRARQEYRKVAKDAAMAVKDRWGKFIESRSRKTKEQPEPKAGWRARLFPQKREGPEPER